MYNTFSRRSVLNRAFVGLVATLFALASFMATFPARFAHAAGLNPTLTVVGTPENASITTLGVGDQFMVTLNYQNARDEARDIYLDLQVDPAGSCTINGKDVKSTFQDFGDGTFQLVYTVAAGDANAAAGQIPFSCAFKEVEAGTNTLTGNSGVVTGYTSANSIAVNAGGANTGGDNTGGNNTGGDNTGGNNNGGNNNGGNTGTPSITNATVTATPSTGTLGVGGMIVITINQLDHMADLTMVDGFCKINNVEVTSWQNLGNGQYTLSHVYNSNDADIAPGQLTFTCNVQNAAGQTGTLHLTQSTSVSIDTQPDDNGLPPAGTFQVVALPATGTLHAGDQLIVQINDSGGVVDFAVDPAGTCTINGKDVKSSFQAFGDHTYQLVYTVGATDASVAAGQLAISCAVKNPAGTTGTISGFTDSNTLAIAAGTTGGDNTGGNNNGGNNNGGNNNGGNTGTVGNATVQALPSSGTFTPGQSLEIRIHQNNNMTDLTLNGACTINGVNLTNLENLGGGDYRLMYNVAAGQPSVAAGQLTLSCNVKNAAGQTATLAFTDGNQVVINTATNNGGNNNGGNNTGNNNSETNGNINGNVQGGSNTQDNGVLAVTQINQIKSVATADGTIGSGWKWEFYITVPSNEPKLQLKFANWMHSNGTNSISPANNMRISTDQGTGGPVTITGADTYAAPITVTGDLNASMPGKQVMVVVEMGVPVGSTNGSYSTTYHVKTSENI